MNADQITKGMQVTVTNDAGQEPATVTHVNTRDPKFPMVRVDYTDGTNGTVHPSQVEAV